MRVALVFDMEGTSHITDIREPFPIYLEYWRSGREKLTNDIVAATNGLLKGGATEVWILNHHGAGDADWPNAIVERLPERSHLAEEWGKQAMREHVDAMFQVGVHARGGSPTFQSHTLSPGLRLRHEGELLSESHWWAWTGNVPVLGMVGAEQLGLELGSLADIPFLAVQRSHSRTHAEPVFASPRETADAIESFAESTVRDVANRRTATPPGPIRLEACQQTGDDAADAMTNAGWTQTSRTEFVIEAEAWRGEDERVDNAIHEAAAAAWQPYAFWFEGLDPTSEQTALSYGGAALARSDAMLRSWSEDRTPSWFEPLALDGHWEGFQAGAEPAER